MPQSPKIAVICTLLYADIFDYPLKFEEIERWSIQFKSQVPCLAGQPAGRHGRQVNPKSAAEISKLIEKSDDLYFIKGRKEIIKIRKRRGRYSEEKLKIAKKIASFIRFVTWVKLIGVTGNLAINNADKGDDIDLLIITSKNRLWITRLLVTLIVELFGKRRHPEDKDVTDKICLNMYLSEDNLSVPKDEIDIFSAHEIAQMKPLFDKDFTYQKFLTENTWVNNYLPNAVKIKNAIKTLRGWPEGFILKGTPPTCLPARFAESRRARQAVEESVKYFFIILENFLKKLQLWYMRNKMTKEVVRDGMIGFHPNSARERILREYNLRIKKYTSVKTK